MSELFDEVDEEVRRDQLKKLWDKYSIFIIALALLVVAGVGGWRGYQYLEAKKAAEAGAALGRAVELSDQNKHTEAEAAFADLITKAPSGYRNLARLRMAAEVATRDQPAAAKLYDEIAADRSVGGPGQDLARIRADSDGHHDLSEHAATARGNGDVEGLDVPPFRARVAGAVGVARQRCHRRAAVAGPDCQ